MVDHSGCALVPYRKLPTGVYPVNHSLISSNYNLYSKVDSCDNWPSSCLVHIHKVKLYLVTSTYIGIVMCMHNVHIACTKQSHTCGQYNLTPGSYAWAPPVFPPSQKLKTGPYSTVLKVKAWSFDTEFYTYCAICYA